MTASSNTSFPQLNLKVEKTSEEAIVRCAGNLVLGTCNAFQSTIHSLISERQCIVVELSKLTSIDNAGLAVLVRMWSTARKQSVDMGIQWVDPHTN